MHIYARTYHKEKVEDLPGPQGPQWGTRMGTILLKDSQWAHLEVQWSCLLYHCRPGQRVLAGHITPWFVEVHMYGLRHWMFPVEETPHGNNRRIRCISKEAGFDLHWTPRSHRHRWWHDYLQNHWRWAWPGPASISTSHKIQRTLNKDKIQFKKTEVSFFGHRWYPKKIQSIINMDFPEDKETMHSFLGMVKLLLTMTGWALCTSEKSHPERHTLHSHGLASSSLRTTQTGIHNRNHASLFQQE